MSKVSQRLRPGDYVEVRSPAEILPTLDGEGAIEHVPFMPEMLESCGRRFRVARRVVTTCCGGGGLPRSFKTDDVVTLDSLRCSGAAHDGCQKSCMIFWREAWLRKVDNLVATPRVDPVESERLRAHLKVSNCAQRYFCQASELLKATDHVSTRWKKLWTYYAGYRAGNYSFVGMIHILSIWLWWRIRFMIHGRFARGTQKSTSTQGLNLQPGEWIEVKSIEKIVETLNEKALNRGLSFSPDMGLLCGKRCQVRGRVDKIVMDGSGEMRQLRDTVCLEGSTCGCAYLGWGMGGCSRNEYVYWREIWLERTPV